MPPKAKRVKQKGDYTHRFDAKDLETVALLRKVQCTDEEIAAELGCSTDTLGRRKKADPAFREAYERGVNQGKVSIRKGLFSMMAKGNLGAAVWLSKQYLGMRDVQALQLSGPNDGPIKHENVGTDLAKLSVEELRQLRALKEKASVESGEKT